MMIVGGLNPALGGKLDIMRCVTCVTEKGWITDDKNVPSSFHSGGLLADNEHQFPDTMPEAMEDLVNAWTMWLKKGFCGFSHLQKLEASTNLSSQYHPRMYTNNMLLVVSQPLKETMTLWPIILLGTVMTNKQRLLLHLPQTLR